MPSREIPQHDVPEEDYRELQSLAVGRELLNISIIVAMKCLCIIVFPHYLLTPSNFKGCKEAKAIRRGMMLKD